MPHAALWVVQPTSMTAWRCALSGFNTARGFVGGAAFVVRNVSQGCIRFNAARSFVGGAAYLVSLERGPLSCFNAARGFVGGAA